MNVRVASLTIVTCFALSPSTHSQALSAELTSKAFTPTRPTASFTLSESAGSSVRVRVWHTIEEGQSPQKSVTLRYLAKQGTSSGVMADDVHDVSFYPLDIVPRGSETDTFYVIGWNDRLDRIVIEAWRIPSTSVGAYLHPPTGLTQTTFSPPRIAKTTVGYADVPPVDACCYRPTVGAMGELLLLTHGSSKALFSFDIDTGNVSETIDTEATLPILSDMRSVFAFDTVADGSFVTLTRTPKYSHSTFAPNAMMVFYQDVDRDGTTDTVDQMSVNDFYATYPRTEWVHY